MKGRKKKKVVPKKKGEEKKNRQLPFVTFIINKH